MITLLDGPGIFLIAIPVLFILFMLVSIWLEGWIIHKITKVNSKRSYRYSFIANLASLAGGWMTIRIIGKPLDGLNMLIYFALTYVIEFLVIFFLHDRKNLKEIALSVLVMNIASYIILLIIFLGLENL